MGKALCCSNVGIKKGFWTPEEDLRLIKCIQIHGEGNWRTIPLKAGLLRCGKACRLRWMNYLRPDIKRGHISADEEDLILRLHKLVGNRWSLIAGRIPGRTDNEIKNHWNSRLSKRFEETKIQSAHKQPSSQDNNASPNYRIEEIARSLLGTEEVYNAKVYASQDAVEPMQDVKQISHGYNFSNAFNNVRCAPLSHWDQPSSLIVMPCNFPPPFISTAGTSAGCENIIENINSAENLAASERNLQLRSTMLRAECDIQIPSRRDEIEDAFRVDYDNAVEPMQNFKQISDGYDALTAINDSSPFFSSVGGAPWCYEDHPFSSMPIACNFPTPFISTMGTSAGYENITEEKYNVKNLAGSKSNMQLGSTLLEAECDIQIPSCGEEIDDAFTVDYDNMVEARSWKSTITAECWEPFSALCDEPNDYILSVEDYW